MWRVPMRRLAIAAVASLVGGLAIVPEVSAHQLSGRYQSPLPLVAYLGGAAIAVALSFGFVLFRETRPAEASAERVGAEMPRRRRGAPRFSESSRVVPAPIRGALRVIGLVAWAWIALQLVVATPGNEADAGSLFGWIYGWVGVAIVSALIGPVWHWLDPFTTLYDVLAAIGRRLGLKGAAPLAYPEALGRWPAVAGFLFFVWLELAVPQARAGKLLGAVIVGYAAWTVLLMSQLGRDTWRERGETFSVWFGLLGRLAPIALDPADPDRRVIVRRFASGLREGAWSVDRLVLVAAGCASVIFDGLSQTDVWFARFGAPGPAGLTAQLLVFVGIVVVLALLAARIVGVASLGAGLVPIAAGYICAHYATQLLFDGQRIVGLLNDPLGQGATLLGIAVFEPVDWLPAALVWFFEFASIVTGHVLGAWAGHAVAIARIPAGAGRLRDLRLRQLPLALLMVGLTTLTLWSLGQNIVVQAQALLAPI